MVVLYGGKIRAQGTSDELLSDTESTIIQTRRLQEATISRIEQVILDMEGKAIEKVQAPRQRLEDLFMEIVERARKEQVATSGALDGGTTAAFLRGEQGEGESLIRSLVEEQPAAARVRGREATAAKADDQRPRDEVLSKLIDEPQQPAAPRARVAPAPKAPDDVDASVIDSLLGNADQSDRDKNA